MCCRYYAAGIGGDVTEEVAADGETQPKCDEIYLNFLILNQSLEVEVEVAEERKNNLQILNAIVEILILIHFHQPRLDSPGSPVPSFRFALHCN